jgi:hypothetical protein
MGNIKTKLFPKKQYPTEITEEEICYLLENTHFCRKEIIDWHDKFIVTII